VFDLLGRDLFLVRTAGDPVPFTDAAARPGIPLMVLAIDELALPDEPRGLVLVPPTCVLDGAGRRPLKRGRRGPTLAGSRAADPQLSTAAS
jgi:hypothetical protein